VIVTICPVLLDRIQIKIVRKAPAVAVNIVGECEVIVGFGRSVEIHTSLRTSGTTVVNRGVEVAVYEAGFTPHLDGGTETLLLSEGIDVSFVERDLVGSCEDVRCEDGVVRCVYDGVFNVIL
jgi:hypothetical protein